MSVTRETLQLVGQIRIQIAESVNSATDDLVRSWAKAWTIVAGDWQAAVNELEALRVDGAWPTASQVMRAERAQEALEATFEGLQGLTDNAGVRIMSSVSDVVSAATGQIDVIGSQLPRGAGAELRGTLVRADTGQIRAIVERTQVRVTKTLLPLAGDSYDIIRTELIRGVAFGRNPRVTAREMVRDLEIGFNRSLTRALVVAQTETLDAHRAAAAAHERANEDVLTGWDWLATLDSDTCPSCWAQHGTRHAITEPGPNDHQNGRCARLPVTKSWRDLGFDIDEPPSLMPDSEARFGRLSKADQLKVMGPTRLELLKSGDVAWSDLSTLRNNPGWRDSQVVTPVRDLASSAS
ncbi:phage protein F-like protein [Aeromicrobium marinum DSM 15272]|uniref:Phage protein F-like protein n=1 Tax=Aeromicrobium marinum DSM 15272 TaxID=585531 RepID=E2SDY6_9ACTN|nr:phage minor head protein [Aeromicrobium marinum]EFQ82713.1 phage protein F-like protein [Aeromicrobium marinum DSM 15272]